MSKGFSDKGFGLACLAFAWLGLAFTHQSQAQNSFVRRTIDGFANSDFVFPVGTRNAPFVPLAYLDFTRYADVEAQGENGNVLNYSLSSVSQAAGIPFLLDEKNFLVVGEYLSRSEFDMESGGISDFTVKSVGVPIAWGNQLNSNWQLGAFVMPLGHDSTLPDSEWEWQYMGGVFARYVQNDSLWWAYGLYADVRPGKDMVVPYLGASWAPNERWSFNAIMPWPAIQYAPDRDWLFSLGVSPSSASWGVNASAGEAFLQLDAWDFGLNMERRIAGDFWFRTSAGIGGFRGLRVINGELDVPEVDIGESAFVSLGFNFRPTAR